MTRTPDKAEQLQTLGAQPVICHVFEVEALRDVVGTCGPDVILHQLTEVPDDRGRIRELAAANTRMRREGTRNLVAAEQAAGVPRFVAQSVAWQIAGDGGVAVEDHERAVLGAGGVVIRYGQFFGPGTYFESELPPPPRVHIDDAARRTVAALDEPGGVLLVSDDQPD